MPVQEEAPMLYSRDETLIRRTFGGPLKAAGDLPRHDQSNVERTLTTVIRGVNCLFTDGVCPNARSLLAMYCGSRCLPSNTRLYVVTGGDRSEPSGMALSMATDTDLSLGKTAISGAGDLHGCVLPDWSDALSQVNNVL